ncbi:MAG: UDP-N-acetylmuramoyl-L-alanine--D-glutamate ligase [Candidatus Actinomarina sp.]
MKKLIFGYGETGKSVETHFKKNEIDYLIYDDNKDLIIQNEIIFDEKRFSEIDEVIISPGIKPRHPLLEEINLKRLNINTDIDLFNQLYKGKIIGVTGTNGKTTFVNLLTEYLKSLGIKSVAVGNVGKSPLEIVDEDYEYVIMELSSFQLYYINNLKLDKAIVLNIHEDHLDWHLDFTEYRNAKLKIWEFTTYNKIESSNNYDSDLEPNYDERNTKEELFEQAGILDIVSDIPLYEQTLYAFLKIVDDLKLNNDYIHQFLLNYKTEEHRFELVDEFQDVVYINDSKSTNFNSLSIASTKIENGILVLHGITKNISSKDLTISKKIKTILVPQDMEINLNNVDAKIIKLKSIFELEKVLIKIIKPGDTVLFSCGGASFNDFTDYQERGNYFKSVVSNIRQRNA